MSLIHREEIALRDIKDVEWLQDRLARFMRDAKTLKADSTMVLNADLGDDGWGGRIEGLSLLAYRDKGHIVLRSPRKATRRPHSA